jgi:hypothetical protein
MSRRPREEHETATLVRLWRAGLDDGQIARAMGRPKPTIVRWRRKLDKPGNGRPYGVHRRAWNPGLEDPVLRRLFADGRTGAEIAAEMGRGCTRIYQRISELGLRR